MFFVMKVVEILKDAQKLGIELAEVMELLQSLRKLQGFLEMHEAWPKVQKEWGEMIVALKVLIANMNS